jgi:hypothetical protein
MTLDSAREAYESLSGKASEVARQLSFGAIALIWIFRAGNERAFTLDRSLSRAALLVFLSLACDFLQYLTSATIWFVYFRCKEKQGIEPDDDFRANERLAWPGWVFFYLKSALILTAYAVFIIPFLWRKFGA